MGKRRTKRSAKPMMDLLTTSITGTKCMRPAGPVPCWLRRP